MAVALVVAAGRGERLGFGAPKALVPLAGRPMLEWSVQTLRGVPAVSRIVVALPAEGLAAAPAGVLAVEGGAVRSASVLRALEAAGEDEEVVIVHDAARPLAPAELFAGVATELQRSGADAVVAAVPVSDTIKEVGGPGLSVSRTLPRDRLWAVQTPQAFRRTALAGALREASEEQLAAATDDAWLIEQRGGDVRVCPSTPENLKVTTRLDLRVAEMLLAERRNR